MLLLACFLGLPCSCLGFQTETDKQENKQSDAQPDSADDADSEQQASKKTTTSKYLSIGKPAPFIDIEHWLTDNDGLLPHVKKFERGTVYVIHFFDTQWEYTTEQFVALAKLQAKYDAKIQVICVANENLDAVDDFLDTKPPESLGDFDSYRDMANVVCITADPDSSVWNDYFENSGRGTAISVIVGKTGQLEWIGLPAEVTKPAEQIIVGKGDRKAFADAHIKAQEKFRNQAAASNAFTEWISSKTEELRGGDIDTLIETLTKGANDPQNKLFKSQILGLKVQLMLPSMDDPEMGEKLFSAMREFADAAQGESGASELNKLAWSIYEAYEKGVDFDNELMAGAKYMAERAVELEPTSGAILDTLAHFVYLVDQDLEKAIQLQKKSLANANGREVDLQPFLDFLLEEQKTGKKKSLQKKRRKRKKSTEDDPSDF
jgi:hypothetical protein